MITIDEFIAGFDEEPGYFDFARLGPLGLSVLAEEKAQVELVRRSRFGSLSSLEVQNQRLGSAVADLTGFRPDQVVVQPSASSGLMHAMFGITGGVLMSPAEFPSITRAAARSADALGVLKPVWLETAGGPVTPGIIKQQLNKSVVAVAVSLVDFRTGYLADLDGIRQVIGDRLLVVDAMQGFGIVDAPFDLVDVLASGGQTWLRAGWGAGFLALSDRAVAELTPVFSGYSSADEDESPLDALLPLASGAAAFRISNPDPIAAARLAMALEDIESVGVIAIGAKLAENISRVIDLADEFAVPISSSRAANERAGIVVLEPAPDQLTVLTASLFNHGVTTTIRRGSVRVSPHVSTDEESFDMLRAALMGFSTVVSV